MVQDHSPSLDKLDCLLAEWERQNDQGRDVPAEELCQNHPELLDELREQIASLRALNARLDVVPEGWPTGPAPSGAVLDQTAHFSSTGDALDARRYTAGTVLEDYELVEILGQGATGEVWKARHRMLGTFRALKLLRTDGNLSPQALERFRREMQALGQFDHPHLVRATDARASGTNVPFLVMEFVHGRNLEQLAGGQPLPVPDACELIRQAAVGLQHVHEHGLVHRDVKPSNLLFAFAEQRVKLMDLGLVRLLVEPAGQARLTKAHQFMGTPDYMAPEQWDDTHSVDIRADIYSLGCTLFFLLTGRPPFREGRYNTYVRKARAHKEEPVPPLSQFRPAAPPGLEEVLGRMLAKDPAGRFATPAEVAESLAPFAAGNNLPVRVPEEFRPEPPEEPAGPEPPPPSPAPTEAPLEPLRTLLPRLVRICLAFGVSAVLATGALLVAVGTSPLVRGTAPGQIHVGYALTALTVLLPLILGADLLALFLQYRPIRRFARAPGPERQPGSLADRAHLRALGLPWLTVARVLGVHAPVSLVGGTLLVTLLGPRFGMPADAWALLTLWGTIFAIVPAHALLEYFAVQSAVHPAIHLLAEQAGHEVRTDRLVRVGLRQKLLFVSLLLTPVPMLVLGLTSLVKVYHLLEAVGVERPAEYLTGLGTWMLTLTLFSGLVTVMITLLLTRDVGNLTRGLIQAMRGVAGGDPRTRLRVVSTDEFVDLYAGFNQMAARLGDSEMLQRKVRGYLGADLVEHLRQHDLDTTEESVIASVLCVGIRGWRELSAGMPAREKMAFLNAFYAAIAPAVHSRRGWVYQFLEDRVVILFGAFRPQSDHARQAVEAAREMLGAVRAFSARPQDGGRQIQLSMAVQSGRLTAGLLGCPGRQEYTVMGEALERALQMEAHARALGVELLVGEE
jgi:serine/threonine protein kinase/class 3 adenylate cyclase